MESATTVEMRGADAGCGRQGRAPLASMRGHIPALDGLRGLAVILVLVHHFGMGGTAEYPKLAGKLFFGIAQIGWAGVDLFFVLSGFLITGILLDAKGTDHYFRNFYARRTLRIFPLYYGVLALCWIGLPARQWWLWCYAQSLYPMFTGKWFGMTSSSGFTFDHFWSLAIEEHFYLFWPLLVFILSRRGLVFACCGLIVGAPLLRWAFMLKGLDAGLTYCITPCRVDSLATGGLLAVVVRAGWRELSLKRLSLILFAAGGVGVAAMWHYTRLERSNTTVAALGYSLLAMLAGGVVLRSTLIPPHSAVYQWMRRGVLPFFGKYSYGIYVYHGLFFCMMMKGPLSTEALHAATGRYVIAVMMHCTAGVAISVGLAWLSWHLYERHFLKLKRFFEYDHAVSRRVNEAVPSNG